MPGLQVVDVSTEVPEKRYVRAGPAMFGYVSCGLHKNERMVTTRAEARPKVAGEKVK